MPRIREVLSQLKTLAPQSQEFLDHCYGGLTTSQKDDLAGRDIQVYTGKIRDMVYRGKTVQVVHSDRLTAFDKLIGQVPYKGTILTAISQFWFEEAAKVIPTHYLSRPHERILEVESREPVKAEVIVRGYLAGSMLRAYAKGERVFCGVKLPDGLQAHEKLPEPIITPTTKAAAFEHDEDITAQEIIDRGIATKNEWDSICAMAFKLFAHGSEVLAKHGYILVDTKYEFGRHKEKSDDIAVIDEIHTPDSSRFWLTRSYQERFDRRESPEMLDKEIVRRWLSERGFQGEGQVPSVPADVLVGLCEVYLDVAEKLTGQQIETEGPGQNPALD